MGCYYNSSVAFWCGMSYMQNYCCISLFLVWLQACNLCPPVIGEVQAGFVTDDIQLLVIQNLPKLGWLLLGHEEPYDAGPVGRAADKLSPLLDPVTWRHVSELYSCSARPVRSLRSWSSLLDAYRSSHRFCFLHVGCEWLLSLQVERISLHFFFWTRLMLSMIVAEGSGMVSAASNTCLSNSLARAALFVFLIVRSPLASVHGNGPSGWERTSLIRRWRLSASRTTRARRFLSACRMMLFQLLAEVFFRISDNFFRLFFVIFSWNWAFGVSSSRRSRLNSSYAAMTNWCASRVSLATSGGARVPAEILINSLSFGSIGFVQSLSRSLTMDWTSASSLMMCRYGGIHSASHHFSELPQVQCCGEVTPLHSTPFQAKARCVSCCLCISVDCFLDDLIHWDAVEWILATSWTLKQHYTNCWCTSGWSMGRRDIVA